MPLLPERPRTRIEEIMRARGVSQTEIARRTGWHASSVNRLALGRTQLVAHTRRVLARVLEVHESAFHEPVGALIPMPRTRSRAYRDIGFDARLAAVLALLGVTDLNGLTRFLLGGDYAGLPPAVAQRLRELLRNENQG